MNPFELLEVSQDANPDEVRAAYHKLAKQWHPDRFAGDEKASAEEKFRQLAEAFAILKDPVKRQSYVTTPKPSAPGTSPGSPVAHGTPFQERSAENWADEARKAMAASQYDQARGFIQYALRLESSSAEFLLLHAQILQAEGRDHRGAVKAFEGYLKVKPKDVEAMLQLANLYGTQGMQARAQRLVDEARAIDPKHKRFQVPAEGKPKAQATAPEPAGLLDQLKGLWGKLAGKGQ